MTVNTEFQLTTTSINELKCNPLKKELNKMLKAVEAGKKSIWDYAIAIESIVTAESYVEDFETKQNFATSINVSPSTITNYVNAVRWVRENNFEKPYKITVGKAYMMSALDLDLQSQVHEELERSGLDVANMSDKAFKDIIDYLKKRKKGEVDSKKKANKESDETTEKESDSTTNSGEESTKEDVSHETSETDGNTCEEEPHTEYIRFTLNNVSYAIPAHVLAKYEEKGEKQHDGIH